MRVPLGSGPNGSRLTSPEEPEWMAAETRVQVPKVLGRLRLRACYRDRGEKSQRSDPADDAGHGDPPKRGFENAPQPPCHRPPRLNVSFALREPKAGT